MIRWLARSRTPPDPGPYDAVIEVGPHNLPPGTPVELAMADIRRAVGMLPGAATVSVQHVPLGSGRNAVRVFPLDGSVPPEPLQLQVTQAVMDAVAASAPAAVPAAPAALPAAVMGFAEGQSRFLPDLATNATPSAPDDGEGWPAMTDLALLTTLFGYVLPKGTTGADLLAERVLQRFGSYAAVLSAPDSDLREMPGLGVHCLAAIRLTQASSLRLARAVVMDQPLLDGSAALIDYLTAVLAREAIEHFRILFLDASGRLRADEAQARGTVNHTPVYPREVVRRALELRATSLILVHNHPSGDPSPSPDDIAMTARVAAAAAAVGLTVRDHIIVGTGRWLSLRQAGLLPD